MWTTSRSCCSLFLRTNPRFLLESLGLATTLVILAIARIVRYPDQPTAADVAVTVADEWQGRGVATALLQALMRHRPVGVTQIVTEVAADNAASLAMLRRLGDLRATSSGHGTFSVVVDIHVDACRPSPSSPGRGDR